MNQTLKDLKKMEQEVRIFYGDAEDYYFPLSREGLLLGLLALESKRREEDWPFKKGLLRISIGTDTYDFPLNADGLERAITLFRAACKLKCDSLAQDLFRL